MYQIHYTWGYEIQVIGDLCRIANSDNQIVFSGTYDACVSWLKTRTARESNSR